MFGIASSLSHAQRLTLGVVVLLFVDCTWVASSELTEYIFKNAKYEKPFFITYVKTVLFSMYLLGFIFWRSWRDQCFRRRDWKVTDTAPTQSPTVEVDSHLGDAIFVPIRFDTNHSHYSGTESDDAGDGGSGRAVRFNNLSEVRQLSEKHAEEALMSRLSYEAFKRAEEERSHANNRLTVKQVAKLALFFCLMWFFANYGYQLALLYTEAGIANALSSTSAIFTLVIAPICPSSPGDKFTLSKLVAVFLSLGGVIIVCLSDTKFEFSLPAGALWGLASAALYTFYLILVRRRVNHEDCMDVSMFFGFMGLICTVVILPGFFILHYSQNEEFQWPSRLQWLFIIMNGLIGTVLSEILWLWGCFLTSSLLATLSLSLTIPLTIIADFMIKSADFTNLFYLGSIPIFIAFIAVILLTHWENWDPVLLGLKKLMHCLCRHKIVIRMRELDREQTTSLINGENP